MLRIGVPLLGLAGAFQIFDGIQTVSTGALRGLVLKPVCRCWPTWLDIGFSDCRWATPCASILLGLEVLGIMAGAHAGSHRHRGRAAGKVGQGVKEAVGPPFVG